MTGEKVLKTEKRLLGIGIGLDTVWEWKGRGYWRNGSDTAESAKDRGEATGDRKWALETWQGRERGDGTGGMGDRAQRTKEASARLL